MLSSVRTPCIGVCSTGIGDSVCRGCKRFAEEVIQWNAYDEQQRHIVMMRLQQLLTQVLQARLEIVDVDCLQQQLLAQQVRVYPDMNLYYQAYEAIRAFGGQLKSLERIGCRALGEWRVLSVVEFKRALEEDFYELSCAHYERYFSVLS